MLSQRMVDEGSSGPFEKRHTDEELLAFVREGEVVTTKEVAEHFEYHLQTARRRLKALEQEGRLTQKDVGKRFVWWLPRDEEST
jgi:predicted ArsR family transcriptional regulator